MVLASRVLNSQGQLVRRKRAGAENSRHYRTQKCGLDNLNHGSLSWIRQSRKACYLLFGDLIPGGFWTQAALVTSSRLPPGASYKMRWWV
jgi:hypothetical protein